MERFCASWRHTMQLKQGGFLPPDFYAAVTPCIEMKDAGFAPTDLRLGGYQAADLMGAGFTVADTRQGGFTAKEVPSPAHTKLHLNLWCIHRRCSFCAILV